VELSEGDGNFFILTDQVVPGDGLRFQYYVNYEDPEKDNPRRPAPEFFPFGFVWLPRTESSKLLHSGSSRETFSREEQNHDKDIHFRGIHPDQPDYRRHSRGILGAGLFYFTTTATFTELFGNQQARAYYLAEAGGRWAQKLLAEISPIRLSIRAAKKTSTLRRLLRSRTATASF
jgi:hypothetical protein